jgi:hypothetical protein
MPHEEMNIPKMKYYSALNSSRLRNYESWQRFLDYLGRFLKKN